MPHRVLVAVEESSRIGKARFSYVLMRSHRRHHMQKIELLYGRFLGVQVLEGGLVSLDLDKRSLEGGFNVVIGGDSSQCF